MILPFQTLKFTARLQPYEVIGRLRGYVGQPPKWFKRPPEVYVGKIEDRTFKIYRNISGRNSFLPILQGRIESCPEGTEVRVRFEIHPLVLAFWGGLMIAFVWLSFSDVIGLLFVLFNVAFRRLAEQNVS